MSAPVTGPLWGVGQGSRGAGGPVMPPDVAQQVQQTDRALQIYLPEVFPIPDAREFNVGGAAVATAAVQANVAIPDATFDVPVNQIARIASLELYITDMIATTNVTWSLRVNGQQVAGYNNVPIFPRVAPSVSRGFDVFVRVPGAATITVTFSNNDGGAYNVGASFGGWLWPVTSGQRWKSSGE